MTTDSNRRPAADGWIRRTIQRRWVAILALGGLTSLALMAAVFVLLRPVHEASALIRVDAGFNPRGEADMPTWVHTQASLLTSPKVLAAASTNPKVATLPRIQMAADPVAEIRRMLRVVAVPQTYLINVSASSDSPADSATIVNAVVDAYMVDSVELAVQSTREQINSLEKYLADLKSQSADLDRKWIELVKRNEVRNDATRPGQINADHGKQIEAKLVEIDIKQAEIQAHLEALRSRKDDEAVKLTLGLETDLEAANILERTLKAKLRPSRDEAKAQEFNEVQIALVKESRASLINMQESINRRLEQLKFSSQGESPVRVLSVATPGRAVVDRRLPIMAVIPFVAFTLVIGVLTCLLYWTSPGLAKAVPLAEV